MIKVTVKEQSQDEKGYRQGVVVKEHKDAVKASVHNGILSLFPEAATSTDFGQAIAGYESSVWVGWEKV